MSRMMITLAKSKEKAKTLRTNSFPFVAYRPSVLREYPCIRFNDTNNICAPLIELISNRVTHGIYFDLVEIGSGSIFTEIGRRFEEYCFEILRGMFPEADGGRETEYVFKKNKRNTPDIFLLKKGSIGLVIECKAKRMSVLLRYSDKSAAAFAKVLDEVAQGVVQIWRYASHVRQNLVEDHTIKHGAVGLVLTVDPWVLMAKFRYAELLRAAQQKCEDDADITDEDKLPIAFMSADDFERLVRRCTVVSLLITLRALASESHAAYEPVALHNELNPGVSENNVFPYASKLTELLPWWQRLTMLESKNS